MSYEVAELSEAITLAASTGNPAKIVIDAGVRYPEYYVLISPSKAAGSIGKRELSVNISGIGNFKTHAITYRPNYLYSLSPDFIFEHSAVFRMENSNLVVDSGQSSFTKSKIVIYLINATFNPFSTTENINLVFYPVSYGGSEKYSGTIEFECYDEKTASWWNETLSSIYGSANVSKNGNKITLKVNNVDLSINYFVATATTAGKVEYSQELSPAHLKPLLNNRTTHQLSTGQSKEFGVAVLDKFMNPIRDPERLSSVTVSSDCGSCNVYTNPNGEVWCDFTAGDEECTGSITFTLNGNNIEYHVHVKRPITTGGSIFDVSWNVSSYDWNVSLVGPQKAFKVSVLYGTSPVKGAVVDISTDAPNLVSYPESVTTDRNGEGVVTVTALEKWYGPSVCHGWWFRRYT